MSDGKTIPCRLLAVDLDGTLLSRQHTIHAADVVALQKARGAGIHVAICTGRMALECGGAVAALQLTGPGIFANGAMVSDMATGKTTTLRAMDAALAERIVDFFGSLGHAVIVLADNPETRTGQYILTDHAEPHTATKEWMLMHRVHALAERTIEPRYRERIARLSVVVNSGESEPIEKRLASEFAGQISFYDLYSAVYDCRVIEVFAATVNKWTGILEVCRQMEIDPAGAVAIGDDVNDIPMLQNAALSFAMGNARDVVKQAARHITGAQSDGGVAQVIDGILAGRWRG